MTLSSFHPDRTEDILFKNQIISTPQLFIVLSDLRDGRYVRRNESDFRLETEDQYKQA